MLFFVCRRQLVAVLPRVGLFPDHAQLIQQGFPLRRDPGAAALGVLPCIPLAGHPLAQQDAVLIDVLGGDVDVAMGAVIFHGGLVGSLPLAVVPVRPVHTEGFQLFDLGGGQGSVLISGPLAAQPDAQRHAVRRDVLDGDLEVIVLEMVLDGSGIVLFPEDAASVPHHAQRFQPLDAVIREAAALIALAVVDDPLAQREAALILIMDRHQKVGVAVAVPPGRGPAVLPRQLKALFPVHADLVQPGDLLGSESAILLSGPHEALVFQPAAHGHSLKGVGAGHIQRQLLCGHLFRGGKIALPLGVQCPAKLPVGPAAGGQRLRQREWLLAALLPELRHAGQSFEGSAQLCHRHTAAGREGASQHLPIGGCLSGAADEDNA